MKDFISHGGVLALALLAGACTTYKPLDSGSPVPWAAVAPGAGPVPAPKPRTVASEDLGSSVVGVVLGRGGSATPAVEVSQDRGRVGVRAVAVSEVPAADLSGQVHRVGRGESLIGIARSYGVSLTELAGANRIRPPYVIMVGQVLRIPGEERTVVQAGARGTQHVVRRGENLSAIARRYGVSTTAMARANDLRSANAIYPGQKLVVPQPVATQVAGRPNPAVTQAAVRHDGYIWPVQGKVIGRFGKRPNGAVHSGISIAARKGTPVRAAQDGIVVYAGDAIRGYGRMVLLRHEDGYLSAYAHNAALLVDVGDAVDQGQVIARVGDTGGVTEPQLHFELRKGRQPVDPEKLLADASTAVASSQ